MSKSLEEREIRALKSVQNSVSEDVRAQKATVAELERTAKTLEREIAKLQNRQRIELERLNEYKNRRAEYELKLDELNERVKKQK